MGMDINKSGRDNEAVRINFPNAGPFDFSHCGDMAVLDGNVPGKRGRPSAVDNHSVTDDEIIILAQSRQGQDEGQSGQPLLEEAISND